MELRELIDKVSEFKKFVLQCDDSVSSLSADVSKKCDDCNEAMNKYVTEISDVVLARDISEKKLATSAGLKIDLKRFSGYDSPMDIYTFRSEFKKF